MTRAIAPFGTISLSIYLLHLPFAVPIEEVLFFIVIPICGLLTYSAVSTILGWLRR